jgi:NAD(P)-dependent dehydrogenase (short-subunit alcohol dehydrogenase family)
MIAMLNPIPLTDKLALVTGAGRGNGRAIAIGMAKAGASVIVTDVDKAAADETAGMIAAYSAKAWSFCLDVSDLNACRGVAETTRSEAGPVSVLVNNAGILIAGKVSDANAREVWRKTFAVNVEGAFNMVNAFLDQLKETSGSIINIGSIQSFVSTPNTAAYTSSKGAVLQMTRALAVDLARFGVRVNGIAPGVIETAMTVAVLEDPVRSKALLARIPMKRLGQPDELVGPAVFLASDSASYITGAMLPVDGGCLAG